MFSARRQDFFFLRSLLRILCIVFILWFVRPCFSQAKNDDVLPGVVIADAASRSENDDNRLQNGDVILRWEREGQSGEVRSPFDLEQVAARQFLFRKVILYGERHSEPRQWRLYRDEISFFKSRPRFNHALLNRWTACERLQVPAAQQRAACFQSLAASSELRDSDLSSWLLIRAADVFSGAKQFEKASAIFDLALARTSISPLARWKLMVAKASLEWGMNDYDAAEKHLAQSYNYARSGGAALFPLHLAISQSLQRLYVLKGELLRAEALGEQNLRETANMPFEHRLRGLLLLSEASVVGQNGTLRAEPVVREAIKEAEFGPPEDRAMAQYYLALFAFSRGDLDATEKIYTEIANVLSNSFDDRRMVGYVYEALCTVARERGELALAYEWARKADKAMSAAGSTVDSADVYNELAHLALSAHDLPQAQSLFEQAIAIQEKAAPGYMQLANSYLGLGLAHLRQGDLAAARKNLQAAVALQTKLKAVHEDVARTEIALGELDCAEQHFSSAMQHFDAAISQLEKLAPTGPYIIQALLRKGDLLRRMGETTSAQDFLLRGLEIAKKLSPGSQLHAEILTALAGTKRSQGDLAASADYYERAMKALESQAVTFGGTADMLAGFRASHQDTYREYEQLLLAQGRTEQAFGVVERSRARTLLDTLSSAQIDVQQGADPALLEQRHKLKRDLQSKMSERLHLLNEKNVDEKLKALERQIAELNGKYEDVQEQIRGTSPAYAALTQPQPLTAHEVQEQVLDGETLLLEFSLDEERSHVFAVTRNSLDAYELPARAEIEDRARRVYELLTSRNRYLPGETAAQRQSRWSEAERQYTSASRELAQMLLGPVAAELGDKRLLIVADGALNYIPFAALSDPSAVESNEPLALKHEIVSLPSASVLAVLRKQNGGRAPAPNAVAVLADPVFDAHDPRLGRTRSMMEGNVRGLKLAEQRAVGAAVDFTSHGQTNKPKGAAAKPQNDDLLLSSSPEAMLTRSAADLGLRRDGELLLGRLPYTRREAEEIYAVSPAGSALKAVDFAASRATAMSPELSQYRTVHFATHGLLNSKHPELSGLVLSLVDRNGKPQDGFLGLQDIYNLKLRADLVVLSACETGLGKEISGEGLVGLTRGFMYAGASRVVASLWKVSDAATAELMAEFYRGMEKQGLSPAAALRQAKIALWKQKRWQSPYYWAAFQIQGEWK